MIIVDSSIESKMKLIIGKVHNLPTPPVVFEQVSRVINDPNTSAYDVARIISEDPALTAKILKLTNSSFYGIPRTVTNVMQAIVILGLEVVKSLVISASVFEMFSKKHKFDTQFIEQFWRHSLAAAFMARIIGRKGELPQVAEAEMSFSAGLLHDIGKLVIASELAESHQAIRAILETNREISVYEAEERVLGFSHAEIGAYLANKWNLPKRLCEAIGNHHSAEAVGSQKQTALIHLSNHLGHRMEEQGNLPRNTSPFFDSAWGMLDLSPGHEAGLLGLLQDDYLKAETFLNIARGAA